MSSAVEVVASQTASSAARSLAMSPSCRYAFTWAATAARASCADRTILKAIGRRAPPAPEQVVDSTPRKSLQHTLNNPLAGLLAELQLLEMEDLPDNHREAVERCIELTRRLVQIVRDQVPKDA
ncbi:MAG: hypothetical protein C0503_08020 [Gemmatimonas sp.]|nr:hypothetical protein [Gemmatimonas sp.]